MEYNRIIWGDSEIELKDFPDNSIDTIITDPPYGLSFMGKKWDYDVPSVEIWQECLRVLKPGGTMLCFAGSRTQHRMAVNVEDAGFILKDCIMWLYGSGFPKATDISKQIDKQAGAEREVLKEKFRGNNAGKQSGIMGKTVARTDNITAPATPEATLWNGWKSHGLKPAYEPILVSMKPNEGSYANNALKWGVGGLNIDGGRIGYQSVQDKENMVRVGFLQDNRNNNFNNQITSKKRRTDLGKVTLSPAKGRFPANLILDEEAARLLDEQSGVLKSGGGNKANIKPKSRTSQVPSTINGGDWNINIGGASRFFYCAKASKAERNRGCEGLPLKDASKMSGGEETRVDRPTNHPLRTNHHPTVKPLALMKYLCTLTKTPTGGIVLDPFCGSGTTLMACKETGRKFIGIDKDSEYCEIAKRRVEAVPVPLFQL